MIKGSLFVLTLLVAPLMGTMALVETYGARGATPWLVLTTMVLSLVLTPAARWLARRVGAIDRPGGRKVHERPTPLLGGAAIYGAFGAAVLLNGVFVEEILAVFLAGTLIFFVGAIEDTWGVSAPIWLLVQVVAVVVLVQAGVVLTFLPAAWWGVAGEWALTFLWIVGITNAFNFLDGLDGLATGSAAIHAFFVGVYAHTTGQTELAFLSLALMGAALGFLPYNYKPHRRGASADIFLGDSGSTFLGFTLAALAVMGDWAEGSPKDLIVPVLILAVPIFDTVLTTVVRFRDGLVTNVLEWILYTGPITFTTGFWDWACVRRRPSPSFFWLTCALESRRFSSKVPIPSTRFWCWARS